MRRRFTGSVAGASLVTHLVERYSFIDRDHLNYEVTVEDPKVFSRPWKISMPLYRRVERNVKILEYECVYYLQDKRYTNAKPVGGQ